MFPNKPRGAARHQYPVGEDARNVDSVLPPTRGNRQDYINYTGAARKPRKKTGFLRTSVTMLITFTEHSQRRIRERAIMRTLCGTAIMAIGLLFARSANAQNKDILYDIGERKAR